MKADEEKWCECSLSYNYLIVKEALQIIFSLCNDCYLYFDRFTTCMRTFTSLNALCCQKKWGDVRKWKLFQNFLFREETVDSCTVHPCFMAYCPIVVLYTTLSCNWLDLCSCVALDQLDSLYIVEWVWLGGIYIIGASLSERILWWFRITVCACLQGIMCMCQPSGCGIWEELKSNCVTQAIPIWLPVQWTLFLAGRIYKRNFMTSPIYYVKC